MEKVNGLTPCITRPGAKKKSRGRRVTICPEERTEHQLSLDQGPNNGHNDTPEVKRFRHSMGMSRKFKNL